MSQSRVIPKKMSRAQPWPGHYRPWFPEDEHSKAVTVNQERYFESADWNRSKKKIEVPTM